LCAGRPITDIVFTLVYPELVTDAEEVLRILVFVEKEVTSSSGRWYEVRIMPYRTLENKIDGLVLILTDITASKEPDAALRQTQAGLKKRITNKEAELSKTKKRLQSETKQKNKKEDSNETMKYDEPPEGSSLAGKKQIGRRTAPPGRETITKTNAKGNPSCDTSRITANCPRTGGAPN